MNKKHKLWLVIAIIAIAGLVTTACTHKCNFGNWVLTKIPNIRENGEQIGTCACGETTTREVQWQVTTLAGSTEGFADGQGADARFIQPTDVAVDIAGNVYVADSNDRIRKITPAGLVSTLAGNDESGFADGQGAAARFNGLSGIAVDSAGNIYVADRENHRIRKITPTGLVTTLAGSGGFREGGGGFADGQGNTALFFYPGGIAVDSAGNIYIADGLNHRIRRITPDGAVSTLAGRFRGFRDALGEPLLAMFNWPTGIAVDSDGNLYVADMGNNSVRKITTARSVNVLTLTRNTQGFSDGQVAVAQFNNLTNIAVDSVGNIYIADSQNHRIRMITPAGFVTTLAGSGGFGWDEGGFADGQGADARFNIPGGIAVDSVGNIYVADVFNHRIRKMTIVPITESAILNLPNIR